ATGVEGDAIAVARDVEARAEGDDRGIDGAHAVVDDGPASRPPVVRVAAVAAAMAGVVPRRDDVELPLVGRPSGPSGRVQCWTRLRHRFRPGDLPRRNRRLDHDGSPDLDAADTLAVLVGRCEGVLNDPGAAFDHPDGAGGEGVILHILRLWLDRLLLLLLDLTGKRDRDREAVGHGRLERWAHHVVRTQADAEL